MPGPTSATHSLLTVPTGADEKSRNTMFATDSFTGAEIRYRQERIRSEFGTARRWTRAARATKKN